MITCHVPYCTQPTEPDGEPWSMVAFSVDGEADVWFQNWKCLAGHHYQVEVWG